MYYIHRFQDVDIYGPLFCYHIHVPCLFQLWQGFSRWGWKYRPASVKSFSMEPMRNHHGIKRASDMICFTFKNNQLQEAWACQHRHIWDCLIGDWQLVVNEVLIWSPWLVQLGSPRVRGSFDHLLWLSIVLFPQFIGKEEGKTSLCYVGSTRSTLLVSIICCLLDIVSPKNFGLLLYFPFFFIYTCKLFM